mgnify:CR=1 FL=1
MIFFYKTDIHLKINTKSCLLDKMLMDWVVCVCVCAHRAVENHTVSIAQALDVCCQVEADGSMTDGVHGLSIEEVVGPRWKGRWAA